MYQLKEEKNILSKRLIGVFERKTNGEEICLILT